MPQFNADAITRIQQTVRKVEGEGADLGQAHDRQAGTITQIVKVTSATPTAGGEYYPAVFQQLDPTTGDWTDGAVCLFKPTESNGTPGTVSIDAQYHARLWGAINGTGVFVGAGDGSGGTVDPDTAYLIGSSPYIQMTTNNWAQLIDFDAGIVATGKAKPLHGLWSITNVGTGPAGSKRPNDTSEAGSTAAIRYTGRDTYCATGDVASTPISAQYFFTTGQTSGIGAFMFDSITPLSRLTFEIKSDTANRPTQVRIDFVAVAGN